LRFSAISTLILERSGHSMSDEPENFTLALLRKIDV